MHLVYPVVLSSLLFAIGVYGVLARRNAILVLMAVELMLSAVNLNLVAFDVWLRDKLHAGQALTLFTITIAAAEIGLGLAIVLMVFRNRGSTDVDRLRELADADGRSLFASGTDPADAADDASGSEAADTAGKKAAVA
ncbi:NADH-quinone oxidoreductase subunit NuoK [Streptacidiphilus monticola]|jgi:NADH-quinone oxidoreductase subunit K|uniref:NADH-quinone oxidoreductase subunit K n=1 Tax=Streptacidiphilus monticola TaxID=2161674 RepID=A0ABW1G9K6_9ACTN